MAPLRSHMVMSRKPAESSSFTIEIGRRARAGGDDLHVLFLLADDLQRIGETRQRDDGGAVLVVVEDRDVALFLQLALDLEAAGRGDILKVDAAEASRR